MEQACVSFLLPAAETASVPRHSHSRRRARLNFQRRGSTGDGWEASGAGGLAAGGCGAVSDGRRPGVRGPAVGGGAVGAGIVGGHSRAWFTTSRICSNHQLARFERPRPRRAGLSPGWFSNPSSNWRLIMARLPFCHRADWGIQTWKGLTGVGHRRTSRSHWPMLRQPRMRSCTTLISWSSIAQVCPFGIRGLCLPGQVGRDRGYAGRTKW